MTSSTQKILYLNDQKSWFETYSQIVDNNIIEKTGFNLDSIEALKHSSVETKEIQLLQITCIELMCSTYTHVAAYHCCRPTDVESYYKSGLLLGSLERTKMQAYALFRDQQKVNTIIDDIEEFYLDGSIDKLWLFYSMYGARKGASHYSKYGSEILQLIANRYSSNSREFLSTVGMPTILECIIPIEWLQERQAKEILVRYATSPLRDLLRSQITGDNNHSNKDAFKLQTNLPSKFICNHIFLNDLA